MDIQFALQQQFAHIVETVEALRGETSGVGNSDRGLFEGLMQRVFTRTLAEY